MGDLNTSLCKTRSAMIYRMKYKGEIVQPEGILVIVAGNQIIGLELLHGQDDNIIGDKRKLF